MLPGLAGQRTQSLVKFALLTTALFRNLYLDPQLEAAFPLSAEPGKALIPGPQHRVRLDAAEISTDLPRSLPMTAVMCLL
jgi:hypothetical protein